MKFIHCADLHIDSPLRKLSTYSDAPVKEIKSATRQAFERIIQHCLQEKADFLLISGDLFDGNCRDFNTILWICAQARLLGETPILIVHGNHDYANGLAKLIPWPKNTHLFPCGQASTKSFTTKGGVRVAVHGQSYAKPAEKENLALGFPEAVPGAVNIGLLHCNFEGSRNHDPYAPCSRDDLVSKSYDYWALGHIHKAACYEPTQAGEPWIVYPGNIQGRHIREAGPKGCFLVSANQDGISSKPKFLSTDILRWHEHMLEVKAEHTSIEGIISDLEKGLDRLAKSEAQYKIALRIHLHGQASIYHQLVTDWPALELRVRDLCASYQNIWLEKVKNSIKPERNIHELKNSPFLAKVMADFEELFESGEHRAILDSWVKEVEQATGDLVQKSQWDQKQNIQQILSKSQEYLLSKLADGGFLED